MFDIYATDHCAFTRHDKDLYRSDFLKVPNGLAGTGALFPLLYELLTVKHSMPLHDIIKHLSATPAHLAGLFPDKGTIRVGADADLMILTLNGHAREIHSSYADCYEPYSENKTTLDFKKVFVGGKLTVSHNELVSPDAPAGKVLGAIA